uniref:ERVV2 protein n=1 Tax=Oryzias latipes TaxID=8090 RepID=A0A3P9HZ08_ORYLA
MTTTTGVPWEFRIWGGGAKFGQSLLPWIGVGEIRDHIEINRYTLLRLLNTTYKFSNASAAEMSAIRTMVLQNRLVLDLLTASSGGVCKMVGDTCCTFIPDGTSDGQDISTALHDLAELQAYVKSNWSKLQYFLPNRTHIKLVNLA